MNPPAPTDRDFGDVRVRVGADAIASVRLCRPPDNVLDVAFAREIADAYEYCASDAHARVIVLSAEGKHFCTGVDLVRELDHGDDGPDLSWLRELYGEARRIVSAPLPVVAVVHGAAIGGGLGLACAADFRVASPSARFGANFARLGLHQGFGLTLSLPAIVGQQGALDLLYSGRRVGGREAHALGLCDRLAEPDELDRVAHELAGSIAGSAPLAVRSIRATMRRRFVDGLPQAIERELAEQLRLSKTRDWREGVESTAARRPPEFEGR
jgi:2-(1,2-epoxy-1,2-dihydrophenyl)acetyl-CoA isomerase